MLTKLQDQGQKVQCIMYIRKVRRLVDKVCFYVQPCYIRDWELRVQFRIHGDGKKNLHGDGLAIWLTKERMQIGKMLSLSLL